MKDLQKYMMAVGKEGLLRFANINDCNVTGIYINSKEVIKDSIFICKGANFKVDYLKEAMEKGACCYVSEEKYDVPLSYIQVTDIRKAMAILSDFHYDSCYKNFNLIGITGTKGKSTATYMMKNVLDLWEQDKKCGVLSSIDVYDGVEEFESHLTTPESVDLFKYFHNGSVSGLKHMVMEVSSQALKYHRVDKVNFNYGVFLNIGYDHVSPIEHEDFQDYFTSKLRIFEKTDKAVINLNSDHIEEITKASEKAKQVITFGINCGDYSAKDIKKSGTDTVFTVNMKGTDREFVLEMPGIFNVENALSVIAIADDMGIPYEIIKEGLKTARAKGRMEIITSEDDRVVVIVDYAHNKLSFDSLFSSAKEEFPGRKIISVFGCPGGKALDRRKDLGEIAGKLADKVIITEEDPGKENLMDICEEIKNSCIKYNENCEIITDREKAIEEAINQDGKIVVLLTGKGRETRQKRGNEYIDVVSDFEIAKKLLNK